MRVADSEQPWPQLSASTSLMQTKMSMRARASLYAVNFRIPLVLNLAGKNFLWVELHGNYIIHAICIDSSEYNWRKQACVVFVVLMENVFDFELASHWGCFDGYWRLYKVILKILGFSFYFLFLLIVSLVLMVSEWRLCGFDGSGVFFFFWFCLGTRLKVTRDAKKK